MQTITVVIIQSLLYCATEFYIINLLPKSIGGGLTPLVADFVYTHLQTMPGSVAEFFCTDLLLQPKKQNTAEQEKEGRIRIRGSNLISFAGNCCLFITVNNLFYKTWRYVPLCTRKEKKFQYNYSCFGLLKLLDHKTLKLAALPAHKNEPGSLRSEQGAESHGFSSHPVKYLCQHPLKLRFVYIVQTKLRTNVMKMRRRQRFSENICQLIL